MRIRLPRLTWMRGRCRGAPRPTRGGPAGSSSGPSFLLAPAPPGAKPPRGVPAPRERDRKSTRLNSSHTVISYAVFCLKKKKKNNQQIVLTTKVIEDVAESE